jgi:protein TonB
MGARALYRPMPRIPPELLDEELDMTALARFHISQDGSQTVELLQATDVPKINLAIIDALRKWRFAPALKNGVPIKSTVDLSIPIRVR